MKYNKGFDFSLLFTDKTYRARLILVVYLVVFIALIVFVRVGGSNVQNSMANNSNKNNTGNLVNDTNNNGNNVNNNDENNNTVQEDYVKELFSYINKNNYNFEFTIYRNSEVYKITGKRFNDKYDFDLSNGGSIINYLDNGKKVMAKNFSLEESEYQNAELPYFKINYFDNSVLMDIASMLIKNNTLEDAYIIENKYLLDFSTDSSADLSLDYFNKQNVINFVSSNNKITVIDMDLTNFVNNEDDTNYYKISLKYYNFDLVDDFEVNF